MSISTFAELKTAVGNWLPDRAGDATITANVADFITICEARLNRTLPLRVFKVDTPLTGTVDSRVLTLPTDFVEAIRLQLTTGTLMRELKPQTAGTMVYQDASGEPSEWVVNGSNIDLDCPCDSAHTFSFRYRQKLALSELAPTNWLLTNHPDVYLWGSLVEASTFIVDMEFGAAVNQRFTAAVDELTTLDSRNDAMARLQIDPALLSRRGPALLTQV